MNLGKTTRGVDDAFSKYKGNIIGASAGVLTAIAGFADVGKHQEVYRRIADVRQRQFEAAKKPYGDATDPFEAAKEKIKNAQKALKTAEDNDAPVEEKEKARAALNEALQQEDRLRQASLNKRQADADAAVKPLIAAFNKAAQAIDNFTRIVREGQQRFGLSAGQALVNEYQNAFASMFSFADTFVTGRAGVSAKEISGAQQSMQAEFGGVISSTDAKELARQAKEMGVATQQLAQARRVFMTTTMGDLGRAASEQDKFVTAFQQKGLTSKDAMEAIGKNGELIARAGTRFADSFAKAAIESKKIGVELSKVNQVGDNIIGNFEGFLESQAELGAMGFGFDTSRLAEIAESGDTGALMEELRSQLAMTGKDLTDLRRSEQLALSSAFGIEIGELQRMAGQTPELSEQQKNREIFSKLLNIVESFGKLLGVVATVLTGIHLVLLGGIYKNTLLIPGAIGSVVGTVLKGVGAAAGLAGVAAGSSMAYSTAAEGNIGGIIGSILFSTASGAGTGALLGAGVPGALIGGGIGLGAGIIGAVAGANADDMVSKPGYGSRALVTPTGVIALNNQDNVVAYADDMISQEAKGVTMLSKGEIASKAEPSTIDFSELTKKLDQVIGAINSKDNDISVVMEAEKVGRILARSTERSAQSNIFRPLDI
jgi:hypothetical protein